MAVKEVLGVIDTIPSSLLQESEFVDAEFGRCPVCSKPLRPRCRYTKEPRIPEAGLGDMSRARCDRCFSIIEYVGDTCWVVICLGVPLECLPELRWSPGCSDQVKLGDVPAMDSAAQQGVLPAVQAEASDGTKVLIAIVPKNQ